jgi:regulator of protease activity HflC (stomatin/prohibitin superfamily)
MSGFESYAAKKNDLIQYITDQLNNGVYKTQTIEKKVFDELSQQEKVVRVAEIVLKEGVPVRQEISPFSAYGLEISQLSISNIRYDDKVKDQIKQQQEINMQIQTAIAQALEARQNAIKAEEQGKATAAKEKWAQEALKATAVTKAEQERDVAKLAAEQAKYIADKVIQEGRAEAEANRAKVAAGLTPQERAEWEFKTKTGIAKAFAEYKGNWVPTVLSDSQGSNSNQAMDAIGIKMLLDVMDKMGK